MSASSCVALFCLLGSAHGSVTTGKMRVLVRDALGSPLRAAQVTAETVESLSRRTASTDESGEAVFLGLDPSASYVVTTRFPGYVTGRHDNVLVRTGETTTVRVEISPSLSERVKVVARSPLVDVTTAMAGQDLTLELTDSLPTGRSYQSYLQFVPGVGVSSLGKGWGENPSSRSGTNYTARGDGPGIGFSSDNLYYIEGINVTGIYLGTTATSFNTEAIQEQNVITGGIPAEYKGVPGLISNVVTKSGGNRFSGSVNFYFQNNDLLADDKRGGNYTTDDFQAFDTAFTLGGPIRRDRAWFFVSYRKLNRKDYVENAAPGGFQRTVERDEDQYYAKLTWQVTNQDRLSATFLADPWDSSGSDNPQVVNHRLVTVDQGSPRYVVGYQRVFGSGVLDLDIGEHVEEQHDRPVFNEPRNDILFDIGETYTLEDQQQGGNGEIFNGEDSNDFVEGSLEWLVASSWGQHTIKGGFVYEDHNIHDDSSLVGSARYRSLSSGMAAVAGMPVTAGYVSTTTLSTAVFPPWDVYSNSHLQGLIATVDTLPDRDTFYALLDADADGTITMDEAASGIVFDSTAGNPHGAINYHRRYRAETNVTNVGSEGLSFYLQDTLQRGRWTFYAGVRAEQWEHFSSAGDRIAKFDWELAPRLSLIRDLAGDGKQKLSLFYGRYYDPARNNLTAFAGELLRPQVDSQVFVNDQWVTFDSIGGVTNPDAVFAPTTRTPYTDEWQLGYEIDLGHNMSLSAHVIKRETRDLMEDYDLRFYAFRDDGTTDYPGPLDHADSLFLGLGYFGLEQFPESQYVIATLAGGWRDWEGVDLVFRKRLVNRWQAIASYSYSDGKGNTISDADAAFQADRLPVDPRAPNATGTLPGTVHHRVKLLGSYGWDNGLKVGATYRWNSGYIENRLLFGGVPVLTGFPGSVVEPFEYAGITISWIEPGSVGALKGPAWDVLDVRLQYNHLFGRIGTEFFLDVFDVFNDQSVARLYPGINPDPVNGWEFGGPWAHTPPRRFYLGTRMSF